jgi:hypothetical protein
VRDTFQTEAALDDGIFRYDLVGQKKDKAAADRKEHDGNTERIEIVSGKVLSREGIGACRE